MKSCILFLIILFSVSCLAQEKNQSEWATDIEYLKQQLPKKHKNLFFKSDRLTFEDGLDKIVLKESPLSDFEIAIKLQMLIASLGDSHTSIRWEKFINKDRILPIRVRWFKDGIYVTRATIAHKNLLGKKITAINGYTISNVIDSLSRLTTKDNIALVKDEIPRILMISQLLNFFDFSDGDKLALKVKASNGIETTHIIEPYILKSKELIDIGVLDIAHSYKHRDIAFSQKYFASDNIYYIQYNKCVTTSENENRVVTFKEFRKTILATIIEKKPDKVIFDMRLNTGGSSSQGTKLIKQLAKIKEINKKDKLYVAIGRKTFSSAIINTMDFIEHTNATLVGEITGGKPNHYGEVKRFKLPNSGVTVTYSTKYFKRTNEDLDCIHPDVQIETTYNDFVNGIDPVYEWVNKQ